MKCNEDKIHNTFCQILINKPVNVRIRVDELAGVCAK